MYTSSTSTTNHTLYCANMSGVTLNLGSINACTFFLLILNIQKKNVIF